LNSRGRGAWRFSDPRLRSEAEDHYLGLFVITDTDAPSYGHQPSKKVPEKASKRKKDKYLEACTKSVGGGFHPHGLFCVDGLAGKEARAAEMRLSRVPPRKQQVGLSLQRDGVLRQDSDVPIHRVIDLHPSACSRSSSQHGWKRNQGPRRRCRSPCLCQSPLKVRHASRSRSYCLTLEPKLAQCLVPRERVVEPLAVW
ncbi:hypothetical protein THAOC_16652, partial [Thalassiosira oceanica]